eukprot:5157570-Pleurochrysis_carterae.AAC.1
MPLKSSALQYRFKSHESRGRPVCHDLDCNAVSTWPIYTRELGQLTGKINPNLSGLLMYPGISQKSDFSSVIGLTRRALSVDK